MVDGPYSMTQITEMFGQDLPVRRFRVRQDSLKITKSQELVKFNTSIFFSVQRLHGFRQVVTHIQSRQTVEL